MSIETFKCPVCGYEVLNVSVGGKGKMKINLIEMERVCKNLDFSKPSMPCEALGAEIQKPRRAR